MPMTSRSHLVGVAAEVAVVERVAHVVDCVSHEGQQCGVVEVLIAGIANRMPTQRVEFSKKGIESSLSNPQLPPVTKSSYAN